MSKKMSLMVLVLGCVVSLHAHSWTYHLEKDLGVQGMMRYCKYNNGKVYTINASQICQLSIQDSSPGFGQGQGFLKGEYRDGMTKVCVYDVLGEQKALRINGTSICPLNPKF
ncbi:hypothetical protein ACSMFQ_16520 [Ectopseudomonas chengduensis]